MILALDLAGKLAKAHSAQILELFFIATFALESKAALGLAIPMNQTAANATTEKQAGVTLDPSSWERILCGGGATLSSWRVNASVAVALDPKAALGLAIPDRATAANTTTHTGTGVALGLISWEEKLCKRWATLGHKFSRIDAKAVTVIVIEYFDSEK